MIPDCVPRQRHQLQQMPEMEPMKIIHKDQEVITSFAINQVSFVHPSNDPSTLIRHPFPSAHSFTTSFEWVIDEEWLESTPYIFLFQSSEHVFSFNLLRFIIVFNSFFTKTDEIHFCLTSTPSCVPPDRPTHHGPSVQRSREGELCPLWTLTFWNLDLTELFARVLSDNLNENTSLTKWLVEMN